MFTRVRSPIVYKTLGEARLVGNIFSVRKDACTLLLVLRFRSVLQLSFIPHRMARLHCNVIL